MSSRDPVIVSSDDYSVLWTQKTRLEQMLEAAEGRAAIPGWTRFDGIWHRDGKTFHIQVRSGFNYGGRENDAEPDRKWHPPYARIFLLSDKQVKDLSAPTILEAIELAENWALEYENGEEKT